MSADSSQMHIINILHRMGSAQGGRSSLHGLLRNNPWFHVVFAESSLKIFSNCRTWVKVKTTSDKLPCKVIVGTVIQGFWEEYPGLQKRLDQLSDIIDNIAMQSGKKYWCNPDLIVLPEIAVATGRGRNGIGGTVPFEGQEEISLHGRLDSIVAILLCRCRCWRI